MKAILIADSDSETGYLTDLMGNYGFDIIRYRSPVKALDNAEEISPDAMIINAEDYPRHWKTVVQYIRSIKKPDEVIIILLTGQSFTAEDAAKASTLSIQAVFPKNRPAKEKTDTLRKILARYTEAGAKSIADSATLKQSAAVLFSNPVSGTIITGTVIFLTENQIRFRPDSPASTADIPEGKKITEVFVKLNEETFSGPFEVKENSKDITLLPDGKETEKAFAEMVSTYIHTFRTEKSKYLL